MPIQKQWYGWSKDQPDRRDFKFSSPTRVTTALPTRVDLRPYCTPVYNQVQLGSCTSNAIAGAIEFDQKKEKMSGFMPSRLFIYYNERDLEGSVSQDSGAQIRDGVKVVNTKGFCHETLWPYNIKKFATKPTTPCYTEGVNHTAYVYKSLAQDLNQMKGCLTQGFPFVFGFMVFNAFESEVVAKTGVVPMPAKKESPIGGHAVLCVGYDDHYKRFLVRNSWGSDWGIAGYFTISYSYLTNLGLADDFWVIQSVK